MLPKHTLKLLKTICKTKSTMPVLSYARVLNNIVTASDYETTITLTDIDASNGLYNVRTNAIEFLDMSEYPSLEYKQSASTHAVIVKLDSLKIALKHASTDESRYNLHGVAVTSKGYLIATDGHRCYIESRDNIDVLFILSYQSTKILIELMHTLNFDTIKLTYDKTHNTITNKHFKTRTIDAQYLDISIILKEPKNRVQLNNKSAIEAFKRAIVLLKGNDKDNAVLIHSEKTEVFCTITPKVSPKETWRIGLIVDSTPIDIKLNASYLLDALSNRVGTETLMYFSSPSDLITLNCSIIMPLRK